MPGGPRAISVALVFSPAVRRLVDSDGGKLGKRRADARPDPDGDVFGSRIGEAFDIIEAMMIELLKQRRKGRFDIEKVGNETGVRIDRSNQPQFDAIGMSVHPMAAMRRRHVGETVRRLEGEGLSDLHGMPNTLCVCRLSCQRG
jgi:hypothetical protein